MQLWISISLIVLALVFGVFLWIRLRCEPRAPEPADHLADTRPENVAAPDAQRRQFTRVPLKISAEMRIPDGRRVRGATRNLSLMGAYVIGDSLLAPLTECDMFLHIEGQQPRPVRLRLRGRVVRADSTGFAVEFTGMTRECYDNLCYILKYNADQLQIDREALHHPLHPAAAQPESSPENAAPPS